MPRFCRSRGFAARQGQVCLVGRSRDTWLGGCCSEERKFRNYTSHDMDPGALLLSTEGYSASSRGVFSSGMFPADEKPDFIRAWMVEYGNRSTRLIFIGVGRRAHPFMPTTRAEKMSSSNNSIGRGVVGPSSRRISFAVTWRGSMGIAGDIVRRAHSV